jgi:integrase
MKLTAIKVKNAKAPGRYGDGAGLYLQVTKDGVASWVFRYERGKREHWAGLGPLRDVTLAEAREAARDARRLLRSGTDPLAARRQQEAASITFRQAAERLIEAKFSGRWAHQWRATLQRYASHIADLSVASIGVADVLKVLEPIWHQDVGRRVRQRIETVLDAAMARGERQGSNPARMVTLKNLLAARTKRADHHAALGWREAPAFMAALRQQDGVAARALEITVLCALRTSETTDALWSEIDLEHREWKIPPERMKGSREHRIPLSDRAIEILRGLPREVGSEYVFIGKRRGRPIGPLAMWNALKGMGHVDLTVHGMRSCFRDWVAEATAYPNHVAEQALAHAIGSAVEAAYRRGDLFDKRRQLMQAWADYCAGQPLAADVVPLRGRAS